MLIRELLKISEDLGKDEATKVAHKERLDKMSAKDLHAHITKHAGEATYPSEPKAADIKGHALRTARRLGHENPNEYWDKIKNLVNKE